MLRIDSILCSLSVATLKTLLDAKDVSQPDFAGNRHTVVSKTFEHTEERSLGGAEEGLPEVVKIRLRRVFSGAAFRFEHGKRDGHDREDNDDSD